MAEGQARVGAEGVADPPLSTGVRGHKKIENYSQKGALCTFFLSFLLGVAHALFVSSYASAEVCLTGWPNAQPQGRDKCIVARHHQANLMVCVVCIVVARPLLIEKCVWLGSDREWRDLVP